MAMAGALVEAHEHVERGGVALLGAEFLGGEIGGDAPRVLEILDVDLQVLALAADEECARDAVLSEEALGGGVEAGVDGAPPGRRFTLAAQGRRGS